jgi:FAD:protein FMN transferase
LKTFTDALAQAHRQFAAPTGLQRFTLSGATMGTRYSAVFYAPPQFDAVGLDRDLFAAVDQVDTQMSTWKPQSDLNRLNVAAIGAWIDLPKAVLAVLEAALRYEQVTQGAFDIGVGRCVRDYGFGPSADNVSAAVRTIDADSPTRPRTLANLIIEGTRAQKCAALALDLSGIAKGFAVDEMATVMTAHGVSHWLVGIDGEMRAKGTKPGGVPWAVAHERPIRDVREALGVIELTDRAVATSGTYRHWRDIDGTTISHTIDPRTDRPIGNALAAVTVLAPTCMMADAMATACLVRGLDASLKMAQARSFDVICVLETGRVHTTLE